MLLCMFYVWEQDYSGTTHLLSATTSHCWYRGARYRALTEQETIPIDLESIVSQRSRLIAKLVEQMLSVQQASILRLLYRYVKRNWKYLNTVQRTTWFISGISVWKMFRVIYRKLTFNAVHYAVYIQKMYIHLWKVIVAIINKEKLQRNRFFCIYIPPIALFV